MGVYSEFQLADPEFQMPESPFWIIIVGIRQRKGRRDALGSFRCESNTIRLLYG